MFLEIFNFYSNLLCLNTEAAIIDTTKKLVNEHVTHCKCWFEFVFPTEKFLLKTIIWYLTIFYLGVLIHRITIVVATMSVMMEPCIITLVPFCQFNGSRPKCQFEFYNSFYNLGQINTLATMLILIVLWFYSTRVTIIFETAIQQCLF